MTIPRSSNKTNWRFPTNFVDGFKTWMLHERIKEKEIKMKETNISQLCRMEASKCGAVIFRNNVGGLYDKRNRWVKFGLCKGSADLIGWTADGKFLAIEVKKPGEDPKPEQVMFLDAVIKAGGVGGIARCPEDVRDILNK